MRLSGSLRYPVRHLFSPFSESSLGLCQIHVLTHGNSRSRVTRASHAIHARFHVRYTHVPGQNATKYGRYTNLRSGSRLILVAQCGFHRKSTIWLYESTTFPRWGSTWRSRVAIHVVSGSRDLGVDGNSRVIHVPRAPRQFTKRVTRESYKTQVLHAKSFQESIGSIRL